MTMEGSDRSVKVYEIESEVQRPMKFKCYYQHILSTWPTLLLTRKLTQGLKGGLSKPFTRLVALALSGLLWLMWDDCRHLPTVIEVMYC